MTARDSIIRVALTAGKGGSRKTERWLSPPGLGALRGRNIQNRYDSAIHKAKLKKNGVRVLSAKENITDDASGILIEGVLESMAEYYSVELAQKINRGMQLNAEKCLSNGSITTICATMLRSINAIKKRFQKNLLRMLLWMYV